MRIEKSRQFAEGVYLVRQNFDPAIVAVVWVRAPTTSEDGLEYWDLVTAPTQELSTHTYAKSTLKLLQHDLMDPSYNGALRFERVNGFPQGRTSPPEASLWGRDLYAYVPGPEAGTQFQRKIIQVTLGGCHGVAPSGSQCQE